MATKKNPHTEIALVRYEWQSKRNFICEWSIAIKITNVILAVRLEIANCDATEHKKKPYHITLVVVSMRHSWHF